MSPRQQNATTENPNDLPMQVAGRYARVIGASLARAWENVRDWEHLPHLHADSFSQCRLEEEGEWGWRAVTYGVGMGTEQKTVIELVIDAEASRYVSRTLEGGLPGVEIWTKFTALEPHKTQVEVEFHLPHLSEDQAINASRSLVTLYKKLWDEDEAMMIARQNALDARRRGTHKHFALGSLTKLKAALPVCVETETGPVRIEEREGTMRVWPAQCPHMLAPLDHIEADGDGCITCPWHGYKFDTATGHSTDGRGLSLGLMPRIEIDDTDHATLIWS